MGEEQLIAAGVLIENANAGLAREDQVWVLVAEHDEPLSVRAVAFERNVAKLTTDAGVHYIAFSALRGVVIRPAPSHRL